MESRCIRVDMNILPPWGSRNRRLSEQHLVARRMAGFERIGEHSSAVERKISTREACEGSAYSTVAANGWKMGPYVPCILFRLFLSTHPS